MRGLADQRESECEHVYTTQHRCVAAQTRLVRRASVCRNLWAILVGRRIAVVPGGPSGSDTSFIATRAFFCVR